jgi:hypothetical protein
MTAGMRATAQHRRLSRFYAIERCRLTECSETVAFISLRLSLLELCQPRADFRIIFSTFQSDTARQ